MLNNENRKYRPIIGSVNGICISMSFSADVEFHSKIQSTRDRFIFLFFGMSMVTVHRRPFARQTRVKPSRVGEQTQRKKRPRAKV